MDCVRTPPSRSWISGEPAAECRLAFVEGLSKTASDTLKRNALPELIVRDWRD